MKASLGNVEGKLEHGGIDCIKEEILELVKAARMRKGTYLRSSKSEQILGQIRKLQEKEARLWEKTNLQEEKRLLMEKEIYLLPPQNPASQPAGISKNEAAVLISS